MSRFEEVKKGGVVAEAIAPRALRGVLLAGSLLFAAPALAVTTGGWTNAAGNTNSANAAGIVATISGNLGGSCVGTNAGYGTDRLNNTANAASWFTNPYGNPVAGLPDLLLTVCFGNNTAARVVTVTFSKPVDNPVLHVDRLGGFRQPSGNSNNYATSSWWKLTGSTSTGGSVNLRMLSGNPQLYVASSEFVRSVVYANGDPIYVDTASECGTSLTRGTACGSIQMTGTGITSLTFSVTGTAWGNVLSNEDGDGLEMALSVKGATVTLRKETIGGFGSFGFVDDNTTTADTGTSATSSSTTLTTANGSNPVASGQYRVGDHARDIVLTETPAAGFALRSAACRDQGGAAVPATLNGSALRITAANYRANQDIACTFSNGKTSRVTLTKTWIVGAPGDTVALSIDGGSDATGGTSTPEATTAATAIGVAGSKISVEEVFASSARGNDYETSLDCPGVVVATTTDRRSGLFTMPGADVTCTFTNTRKPVLKVTKASNANPAWVVGQGGAQYTLNVTNQGGMATSGSITVLDALPSQVSANWTDPLTTNGWSCTHDGRNVTCRTSTAVAAGASSSIVLPVNVVADGEAKNHASVGGGGDPSNGGAPPAPGAGCQDVTHCATQTTRVNTPASIATFKTLTGINGQPAQAGASVKAGDVLTYTITSTNAGQTAGTTTLTETVPANAVYTGPDGAAWSDCRAGAAAGTSCAATQAVPAGGQASTTFTVTVATPVAADATTLTNSVTSSEDATCAACAASNPIVKPQLQVTKSATPHPFTVGQPASYTITVANAGQGPTAGDITISDTLPTGVTLASASGGSWSCSGTSMLSCVYSGTLAAGASTTLTLEVDVAANAANGDNTATASGGGDAGCPSESRCSGAVQVPVNASADIVLDKTVDEATPNVGETVTFTVTARNDGPSDATGVAVTDALPAGLSFVSADPSQGSYDEATGLWTIGAIADGAQATLTLTAQVLTAGALSNTATKSAGDQFDPDTSNNAATASVNAQPSADLQVNKTASTTTPNLGANVSFTITVRNAGPNDATGVVIDDPLPAGLNFVSATATVGSYDAATGMWTLGDLAAAAEATLTIVATVGMPGELTNIATVAASDQHDPNPANDSGGVTINGQAADIQVLKTVDESNPTRGDTVTFTVTVTNLGPSAASGVRIEEQLPAGLTFVAATAGRGSYDEATALWTIGDLAASGADAVATLTVVARVDTDARVTNVARLDGLDQTDPDPDNNQGEASVTPIASADVSIEKDGPAHATAGTNVTYTLVVSNAGPSPAAQVSLADPTPPGLSFVSATAPCAGGFPCALGDLVAGASATVTVTYAVPANYAGADPIANTATVSSPTSDPDTSNNTSTVTTPVDRNADLQLTKTGPATVTAGDTITYTIVVSNVGPSDADGTTVSDPLPAGLTNAMVSCGGEMGGAVCGAFDSSVAGTIATLPAGGSATLTITANAPNDATTLSNTAATVPPSGVTDPDTTDNADTVDTEVIASANLSVAKTGPATAIAGTNATYTLVVSNAGPSTATAVSLADPTPAGLSFVAADAPCAAGFPCALGDLAAGASVTVNVTYAIPSGQSGTITNTATVSSPTSDPDTSDNTSTATTTLSGSADVSVTKSGPATVTAAGTLTYTIVVRNAGPSDANGTSVSDPLPAGLTNANVACGSETGGAVCGAFDTSVAGTIATLPAGGSATLTITATAPNDAATLTNTASVTPPAGVTDPTPGNNQSTVETEVEASANLSLVKSGPASVTSGGAISYTLVIANAGPSAANGATYSDAVPAGITDVAASCGTPTGGAVCATPGVAGNTVSGTIPTLPANGSVTITITGTAPIGTQTLTNTASVVPPGGTTDPDPANNTDTATTDVGAAADIAVSKTVDDAAPNVGETVTFTITATNHGPDDATGVQITDGLPSGLVFVSATPSQGTYDAASGLWTVGALANGANATLTLTATVTQSGAVVNTATRTGGDQLDPVSGNNAGSAGVNAGTLADLQLDKSVDEPAPNVGSNVTYTVRVRNAGPSPATSVNVTDALPAGLSFVSATASVGAYDDASGLWTIGDLAADAEATLTIVATVTQAGEITNGATAAAAEADPDPSNNGDGVTINGQSADLQVVKTVDQAAPPVNGTVTYTVTVTNNGPSAATNVTAVDALPAGLSFVGATPSQGAYDEVTGLWTIGDLASSGAGASATLTIVATVNPDQAGTTITNAAASAGGDQTDPNPANDEDRVEIVPQGQADVSVAKSGPPSATAGTNVTYAIVVGNAGPSTAAQVNLADPTPAGLVFVSADAPCATGFPCGLGDLAAGASVTVNVTYALPSDYAGADPIANTATVSSPTGDPDPSNNTGTATTPVLRSADLALTKTAPATVTVGDTISYTIVVVNAGPSDADGTTVSDPLPAGLTDAAVSCGGETGGAVCGAFDTSVSGTIATLPSGGSATLTITATAPDDATTLSNTATATPPSGTTDPDTTDNQDTADTDVVPVPRSANLSVTKTGPAEAAAGSEVAYTLRVANAGPDTAEAVVLDDPTPAGLTFVSADAPCAAGFPCALGDLAAGASVELAARFALSPMASGTIVNTATVSSPTPDPDPNDDTSTVQTPIVVVVPEAADLVVVKSGPASAPSGGTLAYRIVVTNRGPSDVPDAVLDDPTPDGLRFVSASAPCEGGFPCALGALANGASATVTAVYDVRAEAGASIANTASASSPTVADPMPDNNASSVSTSVGPPPASPMPVPLDARWMLILMGVLLSLGAAGTLRRR